MRGPRSVSQRLSSLGFEEGFRKSGGDDSIRRPWEAGACYPMLTAGSITLFWAGLAQAEAL